MDLLALQTRANILVEKVNKYEADLVGQEVDENALINEHKYVDLFCLRPMMKLLFGRTLEEKLSRSLYNDVAWTLLSSSAPANNKALTIFKESIDTSNLTNVGGVSLDETTGIASGFSTSKHLTLNNAGFGTYRISFTTGNSPAGQDCILGRDGLLALFVDSYFKCYNWSTGSFVNLFPASKNTSYLLEIRVDERGFIDVMQLDPNTDAIINVGLSDDTSLTAPSNGINIGCDSSGSGWPFSGSINLYESSYTNTDGVVFPFVSNQLAGDNPEIIGSNHEIVQDIDLQNNYNMLTLDATQQTTITKKSAEMNGIRYSYSANIQDAIVTESQVASVFKWNTTNNDDITNNTITVARQVPGIVCYYLGSGYDDSFTATLSYSDGPDLNEVQYNYPAMYGTYYKSEDYENSQKSEKQQEGDPVIRTCCRIFMPGCNYFNGGLYSPQQIWQPDEIFGNDNINIGFNYQGSALYHELVFKGRRSNIGEADFIDCVDIDNDPQGLATRIALAHQKKYYKNRPWFTELDQLSDVDTSKLADACKVTVEYSSSTSLQAQNITSNGTPGGDTVALYDSVGNTNTYTIAKYNATGASYIQYSNNESITFYSPTPVLFKSFTITGLYSYYAKTVKVEVSNDDSTWTSIDASNFKPTSFRSDYNTNNFTQGQLSDINLTERYKYFRVTILTSNNSPRIQSFNVNYDVYSEEEARNDSDFYNNFKLDWDTFNSNI